MERISDEEKKLKGTFKKSRNINSKISFSFVSNIPDPPKYFGEIARREWRDLLTELREAGTLEIVDLAQLQIYCYNVQIVEICAQKLKDEGYTTTLTNQGGNSYQVENPHVRIMMNATTIINRIAGKFGFDPAARKKIGARQKPMEEDPLAGAVESNPLKVVKR